jgi:hypothetical protein
MFDETRPFVFVSARRTSLESALFADFVDLAAGAAAASLDCADASMLATLSDAMTTRTLAANLSGFSAFIAILLERDLQTLLMTRLREHAIGVARALRWCGSPDARGGRPDRGASKRKIR